MDSRPNLLFYSRTNNNCIELLRIMKQYQIDKEFKIINVDNNKSEVIKKIKVIPTMIIPSINKVIIGESVNEFVISVINSRIKEFNKNVKAINQYPLNQHLKQNQLNQNTSPYSTKITDEQHNQLIDKPILDKSTVNITNQNIKQEQNECNNENANCKILGYIEDEMGGLSDKYSYLNINISPIHNYGYYQ